MSEPSQECDVNISRGIDETSAESVTGASGETNPPIGISSGVAPAESGGEFKVPDLIVRPSVTGNRTGDSPNASTGKPSCQNSLQLPQDSLSMKKKLHSKLSPAELLKNSETPLPYKEPVWSGLCVRNYRFDVIKNGTIIENVALTKRPYYVFGRLPSCDVPMEHPSLSRYHAVVQNCKQKNEKHDIGWYLYDLGSTHGTWLNKQKIQPRIYHRLKVGHVLKFGGSTRLYILQGPEDDQEDESDLTLTELKEQRERKKKELEMMKLAEVIVDGEKTKEKTEKDDGCSWGFGDDAEDVDTGNPFATLEPQNEELYIDDPKKSLKGFFEREGFDPPDYQLTDIGRGKYQCTVELPVDSASGEPVVAEATVSGKKREAVVACALEACHILDRMGELRKATHESRKKKSKNWEENDFYDSDDDTFLDRTGDIERKRQQRMQRLGKDKPKAQNYQSIVSELDEVEKELSEIQGKLDKAKADAAAVEAEEGLDALDAFMANIKSGAMDSKTKMALKRRMFDLKQQQAKLQKLANVAKPAEFKFTSPQEEVNSSSTKMGAMVGKKKISSQKGSAKNVPKKLSTGPNSSTFEVEEEEEEISEVGRNEKTLNSGNNNGGQVGERLTEGQSGVTESNRGGGSKDPTTDTVTNRIADKRKSDGELDDGSPLKRHKSGEGVGSDQVTQTDSDSVSTSALGSGDSVSTDRLGFGNGLSTDAPEPSSGVKPVKGPALPPPEFVSAKTQTKPKKKSVKKKQADPSYEDLAATDPDYQTWLPPENQTGDGKTALNEKYGY